MNILKISILMLSLATFVSTGCKDKCKDVTCLNNGVCNEGDCECPTGTSGSDCGTLDRTKFIGNYEGEMVVSVNGAELQTVEHEIEIESGSGVNKIKINETSQGITTERTGTVNGNSFTLTTTTDEQENGGTETVIIQSGSGNLNGNILTYETTTDMTSTTDGVETNTTITSVTTAE